jgi:Uma2 family endonuclease
MQPLVVTPAEYEALPEDRRLELVDGVVHAIARLDTLHQRTVSRLVECLKPLCPEDLAAIREQEIRMRDDLRRVPDLVVIKAEGYDGDSCWYPPVDTVLVAEVVSPRTEVVDRLHKPAEYAEAGIEHYWRIETRPAIEVHTFQLGPHGIYAFTGKFIEGDVVAAAGLPWAKIAVSDLTA